MAYNQFCPPYLSCILDYVNDQDTTNCEELSVINGAILVKYKLYNAYPNPFNPITSLRHDLPEDGLVNITIYDMMGRIVKTLVNSSQTAGYKSIIWNATNNRNEPVSSGLYLYKLTSNLFSNINMTLLLAEKLQLPLV